MIVPQGRQLWRMLKYVGRPLVMLLAWDCVIVFAYMVLHWRWVGTSHIPLGLYGGAVGVIVGFRNNSSYARWWEARTLWGQIVNNTRSVARQATSSVRAVKPEDDTAARTLQQRIVYCLIAYVHALRQHLRGLPPWPELAHFIPEEEISILRRERNVPFALQKKIGDLIRQAKDSGWIDNVTWLAMDGNLDDLTDAQGGTERIKNTPMPKQYDYFPMLFVQIYCILLPIGLVENLGWFTPLGSTLVGFMFLALDKIGRDLEDPFENTIYDLPLTSITTAIETNLLQLLGEPDLPAATTPHAGVLW